MRKITLLFSMLIGSAFVANAQFSCENAVTLTNGFTSSNIATPGEGAGSEGAWVTVSMDCQGTGGYSSSMPNGSTCFNQVFDTAGDDYVFTYTTGELAGESVYFEITTRQSFVGLMAFSGCNGSELSGCLSGAYSPGITAPATLSVTLDDLAANETIYFGVGVWSLPDNLDFDVSAFTVTPSLAIDDNQKSKINLFPNPVKNMLQISNLSEVSDLAIYNLLGQEVFAKKSVSSESQIDVSNLNSGTYIVKIANDAKMDSFKIVKN